MASSHVKFLTNRTSSLKVNIDCQINNLIVTPLTCSAFIMELIKLLVYEKLQIPYPYSWLKSTVNRRKKADPTNNENKPKPANIDRCYKTALTALDFLENLSTQLHKEFKNSYIHEILLCFGANIATPTEAYNIVLPGILTGHIDANHLNEMNKTVHKIMRNIVLNDEWLHVTEPSIPPTNMYVLIKKYKHSQINDTNDYFLPKDEYRLHKHTRQTTINLSCLLTEKQTCCSNLEIFQDKSDVNKCIVGETQTHQNNKHAVSATDYVDYEQSQWFQAKYFLKGFKDTFIDSKSVSNMW